MNISTNVTGRDAYIIVQALAYACEWLKSFGDHRDEPSNRRDMDAILATMNSPFAKLMRWQARNNINTWRSEDEMMADFDAVFGAEGEAREGQPEALEELAEVQS
jgi:hypothetical protein